MKFRVRMLAFEELRENGSCKIRMVDVPNEKVTGSTPDDLNEIFHHGQNDFQPQQICSVSVCDVIEYGDKLHLVMPSGFKVITQEEYISLKVFRQRDRRFHPLMFDEKDARLLASMYQKGYRYRLFPKSKLFAPLCVKSVGDVALTMRNEYPDETFDIKAIKEDGTLTPTNI